VSQLYATLLKLQLQQKNSKRPSMKGAAEAAASTEEFEAAEHERARSEIKK